jgi:signal transduction histidine kinase
VKIESSKTEDYIMVSFQDNGLGLDLKRYGDKVFGIYNNFNPGVANGKGIGLRLVKTQVEAIGGKIELESTVGEGSTFRVYIPSTPNIDQSLT